MSVNKVILVGNCGKDPETRYMTNGEAVTNVSIATSENWKDKNGDKQERTEWHNLVFYKRVAEIAGEYLKKGSQVYVEGKLQTRKWQDKEGKDRYTTEIVCYELQMLGGTKSEHKPESADKKSPTTAKSGFDTFDSDIPFAQPYGNGLWRSV